MNAFYLLQFQACGLEKKGFCITGANFEPHPLTTQWQWTVPEGVLFHLESAYATIERVVPSSDPGDYHLIIVVLLRGGGVHTIIELGSRSNTIGETQVLHRSQVGWLTPGDTIVCKTWDTSYDGRVRYVGEVMGSIFAIPPNR